MSEASQRSVRPRDMGIRIGLLPTGRWNAITDVPGVKVGHVSVCHDSPTVSRTGVTVVWPPVSNPFRERLFAGTFVINGYGEMTSRGIVDEWGLLGSPILLTSSMALGTVYDAATRYFVNRDPDIGRLDIFQPVVAECDDSFLNDSRSFSVFRSHVEEAFLHLRDGPVAEGAVGAGTGTHCFGYKGGIGTASRIICTEEKEFTVGVLVLTNFGNRERLTVAGVPVGQLIKTQDVSEKISDGSCIIVIATDVPLHPLQCRRLAKRATLGLGRVGSTANDGSGELVLAFSSGQVIPRVTSTTLNTLSAPLEGTYIWQHDNSSSILSEKRAVKGERLLNVLFSAVVESTEEAVINALFGAQTVTGREGHTLLKLPISETLAILREHRVL